MQPVISIKKVIIAILSGVFLSQLALAQVADATGDAPAAPVQTGDQGTTNGDVTPAPEAPTPAATPSTPPKAAPAAPKGEPKTTAPAPEPSLDTTGTDTAGTDSEGTDDGTQTSGGQDQTGSVDQGDQGASQDRGDQQVSDDEDLQTGGVIGDVHNDYKNATAAAEWEAGRIVAQQAMAKVKPQDKNAMIKKYRDSLRGEILKKYVLETMNGPKKTYGYVMAVREGHDYAGNYCREIEIDMIYDLERHFERNTACFYQDKQWHPTDPINVRFKSNTNRPLPGNPSVGGSRNPFPSAPKVGKGGWLPHFGK